MFAAVCVRGELFAAVFKPSHRHAAPYREPREANFLPRENCLVAETSAHIRRDNANLDFGNLQNLRQAGANDMGELGRAMQDQLTESRVPLRDEAATLDG